MEKGGTERYSKTRGELLFKLYSQGLAQFIEKLILGDSSWYDITEGDELGNAGSRWASLLQLLGMR
jgi:hypothetical protein